MCGSNPDLLPEVQSATCFSTLALAFSCVTFLAGMYWPFGTVSMFAGIFGLIGGAMVCCCAPVRRQEQTPGVGTRMQASGALLIVGAAIAVGWNLKGGLTTFMSGGTGATKTLAMTKIAVVIGMLVVVWIGNGQLNGNNSPNVLMGISGGLASLTAIAAGVKTVACLRAHGSY